jgi:hypothetical protein
MRDTNTNCKGITLKLTLEANNQVLRFKRISNFIKGYNERKPFYTNKIIELFAQLSDEQIIELLKAK